MIGGVCNNSGGALLQRGSAFTQLSLFARLDENGRLRLVNHLGVQLGDEPEPMLERLDRGEFASTDVDFDVDRWGSDRDYTQRVRNVDADSPARFNANPDPLFEAAGCAGKMMVFAVRLDTFPKDEDTRAFYIGTQDPAEFTALRRYVLTHFVHRPVAGEYMHRDMFDVAKAYGKDTFLSIQLLGAKRLPLLYAIKRNVDAALMRLGAGACRSDALLHQLSRMLPNHLPGA